MEKNKRGGKLLNLIKRKKFLESKNVIYGKVKWRSPSRLHVRDPNAPMNSSGLAEWDA